MNFALWSEESKFDGQVEDSSETRRKVDVLSRDGRKDCEGLSEIFRIACNFTKSKWINDEIRNVFCS